MRIHAHGLAVDLPAGWDGRISRRAAAYPVMHAASFRLPAEDGDFAVAAIQAMPADGVVVALVEYAPELAGSGLFEPQGFPQSLTDADFHPSAMLRRRPGHRGVQRFFTDAGRPFCLYAVLGPDATAAQANSLVAAVALSP